jgi:hypothetical protein
MEFKRKGLNMIYSPSKGVRSGRRGRRGWFNDWSTLISYASWKKTNHVSRFKTSESNVPGLVASVASVAGNRINGKE